MYIGIKPPQYLKIIFHSELDCKYGAAHYQKKFVECRPYCGTTFI